MKNLLLPVRFLFMMVTVMLLGSVAPSIAFANNNISNGISAANTTVAPQPGTAEVQQQQQQKTQQTKAKPKTATKPREKSILNSETMDSPVNFLKKAFSSEEEQNSDITPGAGTLTLAAKALVAAVLSTIM